MKTYQHITGSQKILDPSLRKSHTADRQLDRGLAHTPAGPVSVSRSGKTAAQFIAAIEGVDGQVGGTQFVSRRRSSSVKRISFSVAYSSERFSCKALSSRKLRKVAYLPAYRPTPKDALNGVFQKLQRAARAHRVSRFVQRLAL